MPTDFSQLDPSRLIEFLSDQSNYVPDKMQDLDDVVYLLFDMKENGVLNDKDQIDLFLKVSDTLAINLGLPTAVEHFDRHKDQSYWSGFDGGELTFDMKGWHENLQN